MATARPGAGRGYSLVLLGAAMFIVNAGVSRSALDAGLAAAPLAALRASGTAALLLVAVVVSGRLPAMRLARAEIPLVIGYGAAGVAGVQWAYFVAIDRLPIGIALLLEYLAPLLIALWARFVRHEAVSRLMWPALACCLVGLALVARGGDSAGLDPLGVTAGLLAALAFSAYFLAGERLVAQRDVLTTAAWGFLVAAVVLNAVAPAWSMRIPLLDTTPLPGALGGALVPLAVLIAWVVVLGTLLPFAATTAALGHLPATAVSLLATLEPVGAALLAWWWFAEALSVRQVAGGTLVLAGIMLAVLARTRSTLPVEATW